MHKYLSGKQRHKREKNIETDLKMAVNFRFPYEGRQDVFFDICKKDPFVEISWLVSQLAMDYSLTY